MISETEEWRAIPDWPDYAVSTLGRVKRVTSRTCAKAGRILKPSLRNGYAFVQLCRDGKVVSHNIHQLVLVTFVGPPGPDQVSNHKDADRANARLDNLEYVTQSRNVQHAYDLGLRDTRGEGNGQAILTEVDVRRIKAAARGAWGEQTRLAAQFGVNPTTIRDILRGRTWAHL